MKLEQCPVVLLNEWLLGNFGHRIDPRLNSLSDSIHCLHFSFTAKPRHDLGCINKHFKMATAEVLKGLLGMSHTHTQQIFCSVMVSGAGALYYVHFSQFVLWSFRALLWWPEDLHLVPRDFSLFLLVPQSNLQFWEGILGKLNFHWLPHCSTAYSQHCFLKCILLWYQ